MLADETRRKSRPAQLAQPAYSPLPAPACLMLRSLKMVHENSPSLAWGRWRAAPHPRAGTVVEPTGRHTSRERDLARVGEGLPGQRLAAEQPPRALLQLQPAGPLGDEGVLHAGMAGQPGPGRV